MSERDSKQQLADLITLWIKRAKLPKIMAAARAGMDYQPFYRAYMDPNRPIKKEPEQAIAVVSAFVERSTSAERCTAEEAMQFCALVQLPITRYEDLRPLFPADEWQRAIEIYMPTLHAATSARELGLNGYEQAQRRSNGQRAHVPAIADAQSAGAATADHEHFDADSIPSVAALPIPHRMPLSRNQLFCGRADDLRAIARLLLDRDAGRQAVAITGMGGMGKTNLAAEFAHRYGQFFSGGVFWLNCADPRALPVEVAACGGTGLIARDDWSRLPFDDQVRLVRQAWQMPQSRLLIFDNCEEAETLSEWRPTSGGCRLILTSRRESWPRVLDVAALPLRELRRAESVALLHSYRPDPPAAAADLAALAAELGDLPLALHLAGSYLEAGQHSAPLGDSAQLLHELRARDLLDHDAMHGIDMPSATRHERHVGRTFAISLERLDLSDPTDALAHTLLRRAGHLAPNTPFPRERLAAALGVDSGDALAVRRAARALSRLAAIGFLNEADPATRIHPLVAAFARRIGDSDEARAEVERALARLADQWYLENDIQGLRALLPHLRHLADAALGRDDELAVRMLNVMPFALEMVGDTAGGIPYLERARAMLEARGQLETWLGAEVLNNLAEWCRGFGEPERARVSHEQALAIRRRVGAHDDISIAESCHNLAETLRELGAYEQALACYEQALAIWPPHDPRALASRNGMALLLFDQGRYAAASAVFQTLLLIVQEQLGVDDTRTARTHHNLGKSLRLQGDLAGAQAHLDAALTIFRAQLGDEYLETLSTRYQLALLEADYGHVQAGLTLIGQTLDDCARVLGAQHPLTQRARDDMAVLEMR